MMGITVLFAIAYRPDCFNFPATRWSYAKGFNGRYGGANPETGLRRRVLSNERIGQIFTPCQRRIMMLGLPASFLSYHSYEGRGISRT